MKVIASWSGGKDSCLACFKALSEGLDVTGLVNFISERFKRSSFHGIDYRLMQVQSQAIGIPMFQETVPESMQSYEEVFKKTVSRLIEQGARCMVFGDIDLQEHREWVERVCHELKIKAYEPLWLQGQKELLFEFIDQGFEAVMVSANAKLFGSDWVGRKIDLKFVQDLEDLMKDRDITFCGEMGEYHTFVNDGPIFKKRVEITETDRILRGGYWFLDIKKYELKDKTF
jgi:uncharacterized protein (TIGR00290 family)